MAMGTDWVEESAKPGGPFSTWREKSERVASGFDPKKATRRAIKRVLENLGSEKYNYLEVRQLALRRFLGLAYVSVSAYSRHVRKAPGPRTLTKETETGYADRLK
jgi:hypothetical protein